MITVKWEKNTSITAESSDFEGTAKPNTACAFLPGGDGWPVSHMQGCQLWCMMGGGESWGNLGRISSIFSQNVLC